MFWELAASGTLPRSSRVGYSYNSIVWPFVWKGKMECVSRDRCCAPFSSGGLNIVNFSTKCVSLRLSCLASLRNSFGSEKWHFLARYFLGNRLLKFDKRFSFASVFFNAISLLQALLR